MDTALATGSPTFLPPNVPSAAPATQPAQPEMSDTATAGLSGAAPTVGGPAMEGPAQPHVSVARHILDALGGSGGGPMDWAKSTIAGALAGAANVGKVPEGSGWLAGASRGAQGVQELNRQKMLDQQKQQQQQVENKFKERQITNEEQNSQAERALYHAKLLTETQTRNFAAELQPYLKGEAVANLKASEQSMNQIDRQNEAAFLATGGTPEQWKAATANSREQFIDSTDHKSAMTGDPASGLLVHNAEPHTAGNDEAGVTHIPAGASEKRVPNSTDPNWKGYIYDYKFDDKGVGTPVYVRPSADVSLNDVIAFGAAAKAKLAAHQQQVLDGIDLQTKQEALNKMHQENANLPTEERLKNRLTAGQASEAEANAANKHAETAQLGAFGLTGGNNLMGQEYLKSLPQPVQETLKAVAEGRGGQYQLQNRKGRADPAGHGAPPSLSRP